MKKARMIFNIAMTVVLLCLVAYTLVGKTAPIIQAVGAAQKLTMHGALFAIIISGVLLLGRLDDPTTIGPNLAVCLLSEFYAVIIEFFLLPLRLNAERKMNEEMDFGDE